MQSNYEKLMEVYTKRIIDEGCAIPIDYVGPKIKEANTKDFITELRTLLTDVNKTTKFDYSGNNWKGHVNGLILELIKKKQG